MQDDFARFFSETGRKNCSLTATAEVFSYLSVYGGPLVLILTGALLVYTGRMSVGALMTGYLIFPTISAFYKKISMQMDEKKMEKDIEERIQVFYGNAREDLMEIENVDSSKALLGVEQISFQNVSFTYPENDEYTIRNWNGEFDKTKFVRIAGENGSGKSTLLMLLAGLYEPDEGCIQNEEGEVITKDKLRDLVAYRSRMLIYSKERYGITCLLLKTNENWQNNFSINWVAIRILILKWKHVGLIYRRENVGKLHLLEPC